MRPRFVTGLASRLRPPTFSAVTKLAEIEAAALRLSEKDRLQLVGKLLSTLPPSHPVGADEILADAASRDAEIESGRTKPLSEDAFWAGVRRGPR